MDSATQKIVKEILKGRYFESAVDLGCGSGSASHILKSHVKYLIGVDHNLPRLSVARKFGSYDKLIHNDLESYKIPDVSAAFLFDVIEHLTKEAGRKLLRRLYKVPFVILTTPYRFHTFTISNFHKSLWSIEELKDFGFKVRKYFSPFEFMTTLKGEKILAVRE